MNNDDLRARATAAGLLVDWHAIDGQHQTVSPETLVAALAAMGEPDDVRVTFVTFDAGTSIDLGEAGPAKLVCEDGTEADIDPRGFIVDAVGYHHVELGDRRITLAIAPRRAPGIADLTGRPRAWGTAVQVYSVRGRDPAGFGDFRALGAFAAQAGGAGADVLAISPVHALFAADPARFSPYSPSSRDFLNVLYADPGDGAGEPPGGALVDWPAASAARFARLRAAFERFEGDAGFDAFVADGGDPLRHHALFEALSCHFRSRGHDAGFKDWPAAFRDPGTAAVTAFALGHAREVAFHLFLQWLADRSLARAHHAASDAGMAIGLIGDLAIGLDTGGSHAWSRPAELITGLTIGAPPDYFQPKGQGWGITGFSPIALGQTGYEPYLRILRAALRHSGGVRIDHALGLGRLWVIPDGAGPQDGVYMRYPIDDMLRLLALEATRANAIVIGEDLGVVPEGFRDSMAERHVLGMSVLPFERGPEGAFDDPARWRRVAAAMTSTHDLAPIAGWWSEDDLDWRDRLGNVVESREDRAHGRAQFWQRAQDSGVVSGDAPGMTDPQPAVDAAIALVGASACELAIVPAEDLFGLVDAPNIPGTTDQHPNWRRRLPDTAETLFADPAVRRRTDRLDTQRP